MRSSMCWICTKMSTHLKFCNLATVLYTYFYYGITEFYGRWCYWLLTSQYVGPAVLWCRRTDLHKAHPLKITIIKYDRHTGSLRSYVSSNLYFIFCCAIVAYKDNCYIKVVMMSGSLFISRICLCICLYCYVT